MPLAFRQTWWILTFIYLFSKQFRCYLHIDIDIVIEWLLMLVLLIILCAPLAWLFLSAGSVCVVLWDSPLFQAHLSWPCHHRCVMRAKHSVIYFFLHLWCVDNSHHWHTYLQCNCCNRRLCHCTQHQVQVSRTFACKKCVISRQRNGKHIWTRSHVEPALGGDTRWGADEDNEQTVDWDTRIWMVMIVASTITDTGSGHGRR